MINVKSQEHQDELEELWNQLEKEFPLLIADFKDETPEVSIKSKNEFLKFIENLREHGKLSPVFAKRKTVREMVLDWLKEIPSLVAEWLDDEEGIDPTITATDPELDKHVEKLRKAIEEKLQEQFNRFLVIDFRVVFNGVLVGFQLVNKAAEEELKNLLFEEADQIFSEFLPTLVKEFLKTPLRKVQEEVTNIVRSQRIGISDAFIEYAEQFGLSKAATIVRRTNDIPRESRVLPRLKKVYEHVVRSDRDHLIQTASLSVLAKIPIMEFGRKAKNSIFPCNPVVSQYISILDFLYFLICETQSILYSWKSRSIMEHLCLPLNKLLLWYRLAYCIYSCLHCAQESVNVFRIIVRTFVRTFWWRGGDFQAFCLNICTYVLNFHRNLTPFIFSRIIWFHSSSRSFKYSAVCSGLA